VVVLAACGLDVSGLEDAPSFDGGEDSAVGAQPDATGAYDTTYAADMTASDSPTARDAPPASDTATGTDSGGPSEAATGGDAPAEAACVPAGAEDCTNGVDDDCNGLTDCADPACTQMGFACVDPAPGGWAYVALATSDQPGCSSPFTQTRNVDVDPSDGPAQCSCTCEVGAPPTCGTSVAAHYGNTATCPNAFPTFTTDGGCTNQPLVVQPFAEVAVPAATGGSCAPNVTSSLPSTGATQGQVCSGVSAFGGGCTGLQVCAAAPGSFDACVAHSGQQSCPSGSYTQQHFVGTINDSRGCGTCNCGGTPTGCSLTWTFYASPNCAGSSLPIVADNSCYQLTPAPMALAYPSYRATVSAGDAGCAPPPQQPQPTGGVTLDNEYTVCCQ
jgi:hypothetical protein